MSYSISGTGSGADAAKVKAAFRDLVVALDAATGDGGSAFAGSVGGSEGGKSFSLTSAVVRGGPDSDAAKAMKESDDGG
jgi:hypothetical protein